MTRPGAEALLLACPVCRTPVAAVEADAVRCWNGCETYRRAEGIWRFLPPERTEHYVRFATEYETVRRGEGRGSEDPAFYLALPFEDRTGRFAADWRIRARSFRTFLDQVLSPLEAEAGRALRVIDVGAGNGWFAHRLAERGHAVAAVDLLTGSFDGLGAYPRYGSTVRYPGAGAVVPVQAEFDRLPFEPAQFDLVVFNGSLHYSTSYADTLRESLRVLRHDGQVTVMDSPVYRSAASGAAMVRERESHFDRQYGFPSNALPNENFLTYGRLRALGDELGIAWRIVSPWYGLRWALRPWKARLLGRREPARFHLLIGTRRA